MQGDRAIGARNRAVEAMTDLVAKVYPERITQRIDEVAAPALIDPPT